MKTRFKKAIDRLVERTGLPVSRYNVETLGWLKWREAYDKRFHVWHKDIEAMNICLDLVEKHYVEPNC